MKTAVGLMIVGGLLILSKAAIAQENSTPVSLNASTLVGNGEGCPSVAERNNLIAEIDQNIRTLLQDPRLWQLWLWRNWMDKNCLP